ncbi:hypothetical protein [Parvularcula sp. LCG005]|uniref:hypothetical protein n=1 Tax=Parvularcula sp. LCG005 TaxID=3078805 RepID=UPI002941BAAE|nr:hypothetical protein [Parvularcula sp. LCG005]WOI53269.1 hypothetical protein RUI03_14070 [Parvularcula sp. LCG005]
MRLNFAPEDFVGIAKRRFFWAAIPFLIIAIAGLIYVKSLPPMYESTATLIVEDQQIRDNYVQSAVSTDAEQRLQALAARVTARDNLLVLADELNLFRDEGLTGNQRAERLRDSAWISVNRISNSRRFNAPSSITVRIGYRNENPALAQRVTNRLLTDFMNRSVEDRTEIAAETTEFLSEQEADTRRALDTVIGEIGRIKQENPQALPDNRDLYTRALDRLAGEQSRLDASLDSARQELRILEAGRPVYLSAAGGQNSAEQELRIKRRQLETLERDYQPSYPDVIAAKEELMALERDLDPPAYRRRVSREIDYLTRQISEARRGSAEFTSLTARKESLERDLANMPADTPSTSLTEYQYNTQIQRLQAQISNLERQRAAIDDEIQENESRLGAIPVVEGQLYRLEREKEQLESDLARRRQNRTSAETTEAMEEQAKAEQLRIIEQPIRPDSPVSPDKPRLALMIFAVAAVVGLASALFPEVMLPRVRTTKHVHELVPGIKVIEVPRFKTTGVRIQNMAAFAAASAVTLVLSLGFAWTALSALT